MLFLYGIIAPMSCNQQSHRKIVFFPNLSYLGEVSFGVYLTLIIILQGRAGYEMIYNQRGA